MYYLLHPKSYSGNLPTITEDAFLRMSREQGEKWVHSSAPHLKDIISGLEHTARYFTRANGKFMRICVKPIKSIDSSLNSLLDQYEKHVNYWAAHYNRTYNIVPNKMFSLPQA